MARHVIGDLPFPPLVSFETSDPLRQDQITDLLRSRPEGVSFLVRSAEGHPDRGGYFFHAKPREGGVEIFNFEKTPVGVITEDQLCLFVNHCTGLAFDDWAFQFCQSVVNFRLDPAGPGEAA